jgi:hypothetical protein
MTTGDESSPERSPLEEPPRGLSFVQKLVDAGGRVKVPTTLNSISADRSRWQALEVKDQVTVDALVTNCDRLTHVVKMLDLPVTFDTLDSSDMEKVDLQVHALGCTSYSSEL